MTTLHNAAIASNAWPLQEARTLLERLNGKTPSKGYVLFETGYGPSGLPHIGTFGEVARTLMVRHAFETICDIPTKLFAFSDDMDGLRKVPDNIPNKEMVLEHIDKPLSAIPDPYGTHESYGAHMNNRLQEFLDHYDFDYEFKSSTECYKNGLFDKALLVMLAKHQDVLDVILPTLGKERQETYSPFLPLCPHTGRVLQVPVIATDVEAGTITYKEANGNTETVPVTAGHCKLQWKPDWGMRWAALDVDYEMHGKDLIPSATLSSKISRIVGGSAPTLYKYEMFLDESGQKISKSKGNGLSIDEWLRYAPAESLSLYMYGNPNKAKRLSFDVIPRQMDDYLTHLRKYSEQDAEQKVANPTWHIHRGDVPQAENTNISFNLLLNLASACNPEDKSVLWGFISRYAPDASPENSPVLDEMVAHAVTYYYDFIKPHKTYRDATEKEAAAMQALAAALRECDSASDAEAIQSIVYDIGNTQGFENLRDWFKALYQVLLGADQGPRFGSFVALYGVDETVMMIDAALDR